MSALLPSIDRTRPSWTSLFLVCLSAALAVGLLADVLFGPANCLPACAISDLSLAYLPWREYGYSALARGHLPLWNSREFCGMPFLGNTQTAMFYPPNLIYLALPVATATNWLLALHLFLAALFMAIWCRSRGVGAIAAGLGGVMYVCSSAMMLHLYAGHLTYICSAAWIPLVFLCVDKILVSRRPAVGWGLLCAGVGAMMLVCGWPQFAYYTPATIGVYVALWIIWDVVGRWRRSRGPRKGGIERGKASASRRWLALGPHPNPPPEYKGRGQEGASLANFDSPLERGDFDGFHWPWSVAILVSAALLAGLMASAQLAASAALAGESTREAGMTFKAAGSFSVPPENLLTLLAPGVFGDMFAVPYYGRWFPWEVCVYVGLPGLALATYGAIFADPRRRRFAGAMALGCLVAAMGSYTPAFRLLYHVPGFALFRAPARLEMYFTLFASMLAALGLDHLLMLGNLTKAGEQAPAMETTPAPHAGRFIFAGVVIATAFALLAAAGVMYGPAGPGVVGRLIRRWLADDGYIQNKDLVTAAGFAGKAAKLAGQQLAAAGMLAGLTAILIASARRRWASLLLAALAFADLVGFAAHTRDRSDAVIALPDDWSPAIARLPADARVLINEPQYGDSGIVRGFDESWGYDPLILARMSEFGKLEATMAARGKTALPRINRSALMLQDDRIETIAGVLKPAQLIGVYQLAAPGPALHLALMDEGFDPSRKVILEQQPEPAPEAGVGSKIGSVSVNRPDAETIEIFADAPAARLLLITEGYSRDWRVVPAEADDVRRYSILPADLAFMAVPLSAGKHHLLLRYSPARFEAAAVVSVVATAGYLAAAAWHGARRSEDRRV